MECGHFFCNDCWRGHFRVQITEGNSRRIKCMQDKCNTICDEEKVGFVLAIWRPAVSMIPAALLKCCQVAGSTAEHVQAVSGHGLLTCYVWMLPDMCSFCC